MNEEFAFMGSILHYNLIKPLRRGHVFLEQQILHTPCFGRSYRAIVRRGRERSGWRGVLCANLALAAFGLLLVAVTDVLEWRHICPLFDWLLRLLCIGFCIEKFDVLRGPYGQSALQLAYLGAAAVASSLWTAVYLFFVVFETLLS